MNFDNLTLFIYDIVIALLISLIITFLYHSYLYRWLSKGKRLSDIKDKSVILQSSFTTKPALLLDAESANFWLLTVYAQELSVNFDVTMKLEKLSLCDMSDCNNVFMKLSFLNIGAFPARLRDITYTISGHIHNIKFSESENYTIPISSCMVILVSKINHPSDITLDYPDCRLLFSTIDGNTSAMRKPVAIENLQ